MPQNERTNTADTEQIQISMLGSFQLRCGDKIVEDSGSRARQLWNVLEYLIAFRNKDISHSELLETLWPNDETDNFANTLKSLIYRIRTTLNNSGIPLAKDMIVYKRGVYSWNNSLNTVVDCEVFEALVKQASNINLSSNERIELYLNAIQLYKGDFLPNSAYEAWVIPLSTYYHNLYIKCVRDAVALLKEFSRYDEIITICEAAIIIDPFEEPVHQSLIHAWVMLGNSQKALAHYEYVTQLFYRELGVKPSEHLRSAYRDIIKTVSHVETDIEIIKEDLREASQTTGAFYCEYEVFKNMYQLEARSTSRTGRTVFIALLTVTTENQQTPDIKLLNFGMERLLETICNSLRRGDVIARFSATQYVLMLPSLTYENGQMVLKRIIKQFKKSNSHVPLVICSNLQPLDPVSP
ncbi:BTAD domain-containing putative transcriptional regulator [Hydrogenoanaerobacterium sp.]|uniref:BTAD domain-containing putative transcriptional regulator n=1 Tax=Hydrogenoanaerobacterium sp. TaxID=2953763 RepID=UPI002897EB2B|nr:BTAD domain-containing putative transcriptional regulator [Hydrogenoanaerobacterium sp.]